MDLDAIVETNVRYPNGDVLPEPLVLVQTSVPEYAKKVFVDRAGNLYRKEPLPKEVPLLCPHTDDALFTPTEDLLHFHYIGNLDETPPHYWTPFLLAHEQQIRAAQKIAQQDCEVGYDD